MTEYLTVKQAAQVLGVKVWKIYWYIRNSTLSAERALERVVLNKKEVYAMKRAEQELALKWTTLSHYAAIKGVCEATVHRWIKSGILDSAVLDGRIMVRRDQGKPSRRMKK